MLGNIFRQNAKGGPAAERKAAKVDGNARIYCVGDIHGRADLLDKVLEFIARDMRDAPGETRTIMLGDYIDRGPESASVLERLSSSELPNQLIALAGNHDRMLLDFLENECTLETWRRYGALETLKSYAVPLVDVVRGGMYEEVRNALRARIPERHLAFLRGCASAVAFGDYYFCHAGVRPGVALEAQSSEDLIWIREPFLGFEGSFGKVVVHGHTRVGHPEIHANRINIDTGAFATGALTCLILQADSMRLFSTRD